MATSPEKPLLGQARRSRAALNWSDYLLKDLTPSDEGWEISMALKDLAEKYESYDETSHLFGDGYNIRWKRWFVLLFQETLDDLPNGVVDLEKRIETLERPAAPNQLGPAIIKAAPNATAAVNITSTANVNSTAVVSSDAMVQGNNAGNINNTGHANNSFSANNASANAANTANPNNKKRPADAMASGGNSHDALHPSKRVITQTSNDGVLLPGPIFSVDTQSEYTVRIVECAPPTFEFKASGPAQIHFNMGYLDVPAIPDFGLAPRPPAAAAAAAQAPRPMPAWAPGAPARPVAVAGPGNVTGPGGAIATPGGVIAFPGAIPSPGAAAAQAPGLAPPPAPSYVVPACASPSPAVVVFARRASNASPDVGNAQRRTGWEGMGCRNDYESSISSSENTRSDSDLA